MKKRISVILASILMLGLAACGSSGSSTATTAAAPAPTKAESSGETSAPTGDLGSKVSIIYAGTVPDTHAMTKAMMQVADEMREASGGMLDMTVYPNNQLGDSRANLEGMQSNAVQVGEMSIAPVAYFTNLYNPLSLPFFFESAEQAYAFVDSDFAAELADKCAEQTGFRPVAWFLNGQRTLTNSVRAVKKPEDLKGMKIRVMESDIYLKTFESFGASPTPMSFAEVFTALQQGTIDGQDNPAAIVVSNKFYEVQKYYTDLYHVIDLAPIMVSESFYQSLTDAQREMFTGYIRKGAEIERKELAEDDENYLNTIGSSCEITQLTTEERNAFKEACTGVYDWYKATNPDLDLQAYMDAVAASK